MQNALHTGTVSVYGDCILHTKKNEILACTFYDRARTKVKSAGAYLSLNENAPISFLGKKFNTQSGYKMAYKSIQNGRDFFTYSYAISKQVGETFFITSKEFLYQDFHQYLLAHYDLPLLEWWMPYLYEKAIQRSFLVEHSNCLTAVDPERTFTIHGKTVAVRNFMVLEMAMSEEEFESLVSEGLSKKEIWISKKEYPPLSYDGFNDYIEKYGQGVVDNLEREIIPLVPLKGQVDTLALKEKSLYPQQAACVNGVMALQQKGVHYAFLNEGMGVGKTIQGASICEAIEVNKWLNQHPGSTLADAYKTDGLVKYRTIIMAPRHLVSKWEEEIRKEIPYAQTHIVTSLESLIAIRGKKKPTGKEFFILSKDFCKLGGELAPIPTSVKHICHPVRMYCADCYEQTGTLQALKKGVCPTCNGKHFLPVKQTDVSFKDTLICPYCGNALYKQANGVSIGLTPSDFASHTQDNDICGTCGAPLWGVNAKNIGAEHPVKWYKISHFTNLKRKARKTAFVLKGFENDYISQLPVKDEIEESPRVYGPRKYAPSLYIRKYLKGYFDYCILDECHKYEGAGTAQANAAHSLIKASKFTLGLTGTISNGTAGSFFYLLFMLEPARMRSRGYSFSNSDYMRFCKKYGTVETEYEVRGSLTYNTMSRGAMKGQPRIKAGISPLLYAEYLVDRCVMLDISDLSKYLPPLKEFVRLVSLPTDVYMSYWNTLLNIKASLRTHEGAGLMGAIAQFGLSYPDKPYGRNDVYSLKVKDTLISKVANYPQYESINCLLPKEQELVDIINAEINEGRNCFVYCSFTGEEESNVLCRLKAVVEKYCNLKGRVQPIMASSPSAIKREEWMHKRASEGIKVFICNPKVVETGLDFAFDYNGRRYNYPTIIFFQTNHELSVMWQASRRSYRLNQTEECRLYWLAYEGTLQATALESMGEKMVATAAIQGKFSAEGLAAMSKTIDPRVKMAEALSSGDTADRNTLSNMFDVVNNNASSDMYGDVWVKTANYYDLLGLPRNAPVSEDVSGDMFDFLSSDLLSSLDVSAASNSPSKQEAGVAPAAPFDFNNFFIFNEELYQSESRKNKHKTKKQRTVEGQLDFSMLF